MGLGGGFSEQVENLYFIDFLLQLAILLYKGLAMSIFKHILVY